MEYECCKYTWVPKNICLRHYRCFLYYFLGGSPHGRLLRPAGGAAVQLFPRIRRGPHLVASYDLQEDAAFYSFPETQGLHLLPLTTCRRRCSGPILSPNRRAISRLLRHAGRSSGPTLSPKPQGLPIVAFYDLQEDAAVKLFPQNRRGPQLVASYDMQEDASVILFPKPQWPPLVASYNIREDTAVVLFP